MFEASRPLLLGLGLCVAAQVRADPTAWLYVTNEDSGEVSVLDLSTETVVAVIPVGKRPRGIRVARDGKHIFTAVSGSPKMGPGVDEANAPAPDRTADGIAVIDAATRKVLRVLKSGEDPEAFDLSKDGRALYVSNEDAATTSFVQLDTGKVIAKVGVGGEPEGVTTHPSGTSVYITCERDDRVDVLDPRTQRVIIRMGVGSRPRSVTFTADGHKAYVANENSASVTVIDARRHRVLREISIAHEGARPMGSALSPDGTRLFVSLGRARAVAVIDTARDAVVRIVPDVGIRPWGIAVAPDGRVFTANGPSNDVAVIDPHTWQVRRIPVGRSPWGIALSP
jgi:YVTN family beta-propeller protein